MAIALATCAEVPELDEDGPALVAALAARGVEGIPAVWDAEVDWNRFDLVVVRSAWDYAERRGEFLDWAARLPPRTVLVAHRFRFVIGSRPR